MVKYMSRDEFMKLVRKFGCMKVAAYQRYKNEGNKEDFAEFAAETADCFLDILAEHDQLVSALETAEEEALSA